MYQSGDLDIICKAIKNVFEYIMDRNLCEDAPIASKQGISLLSTVTLTAEAFHSWSVHSLSLRHVALLARVFFLQYLHPENWLTAGFVSRNPK